MKMLKKLLAVVLTGAMALTLLTACGSNAVNDKNIADALNDIVKSSVAAGQAHNVMNNILSQKAANADKLTGKEPGNIRYIGTALGTLTIHGKQTTVRFIVVTADAEDPQHPGKA